MGYKGGVNPILPPRCRVSNFKGGAGGGRPPGLEAMPPLRIGEADGAVVMNVTELVPLIAGAVASSRRGGAGEGAAREPGRAALREHAPLLHDPRPAGLLALAGVLSSPDVKKGMR